MLNLARKLYRNFELVNKISKITNLSIFSKIVFMITLISNPYTILYNLVIKILYVIDLHFIKN